jgi:PAS domain S-box-containing protein
MMRSVSIHWIWLPLLILSMAVPSSATERLKLVVGGDHQNPPFEFLEQGVPTGFNIEVMRAVARELGADVEFRLGPWAEVRSALELGKIDALAGMYYSAKRSQRVDFSLPHTMVSMGLYVRLNSPIQSIEDIRGKAVIVQRGDIVDDYLRENEITTHIVQVTDPADALRLLASGRHDCALMPSSLQSEYLIRVLGLSNIKAVGTNLPQLRYCFAVPKGNTALRYRLDEALNILKVNGQYKKIYDKWFGIYEKRNLWQTIRYFVWAIALIGLLLVASFIWTWSLRRQVQKRTAELREREKRLRFTQYAIDKTIDQAYWMREDGCLFYVNDAACRSLGYSSAELTAMSIPDIDPNHPAGAFAEHWRELRENGSVRMESLHRAKDGRVYPVEIRANHVVFDGTEYNCAFATDITERKRIEEDLREARDELENRVIERTAELRRANELLEEEINVRNRTERVITARLRLLEFAATHSLDELLETIINEAEALTGSFIGFYHFLETDQKTLSLQTWSTRTKAEFCRAEGIGLHNDVSQAGVWTDCIRQRRPVIHNDYASLAHRQGMPPDHAEVIRELVLPVFRGDQIVAIIGVGNKPHDYTPEDIESVSFLADLGWEIAERKKAEETLHLSRFCIDKAGIGIYQSDENGTIFSVNDHACNSLGYSRDKLCSFTIFDIDPEITPERMLGLKELLDETGSATHYTTHRRRDGSTFPVEITANTIDFRGKRYGISFVKDITERKRMEEELRESESRVRRKLESILDPEGDIGELELADILDAPAIQALVEDLHRVSGFTMNIIDLKGKLLVNVGSMEICKKFHRGHPETLKRCIESDTVMTEGVSQGEFKQYRCGNNMWHLVTPIMVGGRHMGNLFMGQFFFENEALDYGLFCAQARQFGFPEEEYMAALKAVPRHSEESVNNGKTFFLRLIDMFSRLSYGNIKLARLLAERDRLTETLRQANLVVEHSPVVLFRWQGDDDWTVELVSANIIQFGYKPEEFLSRSITYSAIIHPDDRQRVTREVHDICDSGGNLLRLEYRIMTKGGDVRWANELTIVERDEAGGVKNFEGVVIDITERKLAEAELRKANMVVENSPVVLFRCKAAPGWPVELVSRNVVQFGYAPEEFLSGALTYASIVYPRDLERMIADTEAYSAEGKDQWVQEYRIVTKDGDIRWIVDEKGCDRNEEGQIVNYEGVIIDITERRKAEENLILQKLQLRELNSTLEERVQAEVNKNRKKDVMLIQQNRQAALGEILDHIAHQWKHPLATISLTAYLLKTDNALNEDSVGEATDSIIEQVTELTQMLNDYRDFYRQDRDKSVFRIKEGIDKALPFITPVLCIESIELEVNTDVGLQARGYPKAFAQVILNLVSNSRDAFKEREVKKPRIVVNGFAENKMAVVTVTDNAGGISTAALDSIFEMNFTTKAQSGGTGIGLYMSRNIIERDMGGDLTAANVVDGAQFCIRLPIAESIGYPNSGNSREKA